LPTPKKKQSLPQRNIIMLLIQKDNKVLLEKRPPTGIWGGLWSLPECQDEDELKQFCLHLGLAVSSNNMLAPWKHVFSHYQLNVTPKLLNVNSKTASAEEAGNLEWVDIKHPGNRGLSAAVKKIFTV